MASVSRSSRSRAKVEPVLTEPSVSNEKIESDDVANEEEDRTEALLEDDMQLTSSGESETTPVPAQTQPQTPGEFIPKGKDSKRGCAEITLIILGTLLYILTFPVSVWFGLKVCSEYERFVKFRLGRLIGGGFRGPGPVFYNPFLVKIRRVDMRIQSCYVPPQEILTADSVTISVDAAVLYRIIDPIFSILHVGSGDEATQLVAESGVRTYIGRTQLSDILQKRNVVSEEIKTDIQAKAAQWGRVIESLDVKDVVLPEELRRVMAAETEATREARAKMIASEGEYTAAIDLKRAGDVLHQCPESLILRYLQTLNKIAADKNSTIVFPLPVDLLKSLIPSNQSPKNDAKLCEGSQSSLSQVLRDPQCRTSMRDAWTNVTQKAGPLSSLDVSDTPENESKNRPPETKFKTEPKCEPDHKPTIETNCACRPSPNVPVKYYQSYAFDPSPGRKLCM